jgi:hypothetical protein
VLREPCEGGFATEASLRMPLRHLCSSERGVGWPSLAEVARVRLR